MLLAGRVRKPEEASLIKDVLQTHFKKTINVDHLFSLEDATPTTPSILTSMRKNHAGFQNIVWTQNARRMATLIGFALNFDEPVLLVGETGY